MENISKRAPMFITFCIMIISAMMFINCGVNEITELIVVGNAYSEFVVGETYDYNNITVKATFQDGTSMEIRGDDSRVEISGFSTTTAGNRNLTLKFTDGKTSASCDIAYTVYKNEQTIKTASDIDKIDTQTNSDDNGILFFPYSGTYDLTDHVITRNLNLIARRNVNVTLKNVNVNSKDSSTTLNNEFTNINFANATANGNALTVTSGDNGVNLTLTRCIITANGEAKNGVTLPVKGDVVINESEFRTPTETDVFNYLVYDNTGRDINAKREYTKNTIICRFSYGFTNCFNSTFENNYIDATLTASGIGDRAPTNNSQKKFVARKNPIFIHMSNPSSIPSGAKLFLNVKDNIVNNVQNFIRVYNMDLYNYNDTFQFDFKGNSLKNVAVLVNTSSLSYSSLTNILADLHKDITTGYDAEYKAVILKDTEIKITKDMAYKYVDQTGAYLYYDFTDDSNEAIMTVDDIEYTYVGTAARLTDLRSATCYVIKDIDNNYYVITSIDYSPAGDVMTFMSNAGSTKSINDARRFSETEIKELLGLASILG